MAQLWWQPNPAEVGSAPSEWTVRFGAAILTVKQDGGGEYYLEVDTASLGSNFALTLDSVSGVDLTSSQVSEVYQELYQDDNSDLRGMIGFSGTSDADYSARLGGASPAGNNGTKLSSTVNGGEWVFASDSSQPGVQVKFAQRFRVLGENSKVKWWLLSGSEPGTWLLDVDYFRLPGPAGPPGIYSTINRVYRVYGFGVGTNGDPAPTGPVDPGGDEVGDITSAASSTDSWAAQVQSAVSLTSAAAASDQATAIASVNLSIMEAAQAADATGDAPAAVGSMTDAATGNDTVDALVSAAAAISAGASAGESWTVQAQALVNLVEQGAAADEIRRQTESAVTAALEAQSLASDQFIAALDTIASLSDSASVTDAYQAVVLQLASIASGAVASDSFRMLFGLQRAIQEAALADASFSISYAFVNALRSGGLSGDAWAVMANLNASLSDICSVADLMRVRASTTARLTAGAIASSSFAIVNAGVRYLIMGAVILRDALQYRVNTKPALNQSVKIKPGH